MKPGIRTSHGFCLPLCKLRKGKIMTELKKKKNQQYTFNSPDKTEAKFTS